MKNSRQRKKELIKEKAQEDRRLCAERGNGGNSNMNDAVQVPTTQLLANQKRRILIKTVKRRKHYHFMESNTIGSRLNLQKKLHQCDSMNDTGAWEYG